MTKNDYKKCKITRRLHVHESYGSTFIVESLDSFNSELQVADTESAMKNKLIELLFEGLNFWQR